jgi:hypothetical protein
LRRGWLFPKGLSDTELRRRTLTNLYNDAPTWLRQAHERLDRAVLAAYGWSYPMATDQVLEGLIQMNATRRAVGDAEAA